MARPQGRLLTIEDIAKLRFVGDPQLTPDASSAAFVVTEMDMARDTYRSAIWTVKTANGATRQVTDGTGRDRAPRWSPSGRTLAFISDRSGDAQLWIATLNDGDARRITSVTGEVAEPRWSPDGTHIAFRVKCADPNKTPEPRVARVINSLRYRNDEAGYLEGCRWHLFIVNVEDQTVRQVTSGDWDDFSPTWSPEGLSLAFVSSRGNDRDYTAVADLWVVSSAGGQPRKLTNSSGLVSSPAWSPDGRWLAYRGHDQGSRWDLNCTVHVIATKGGKPIDLTKDFDRTVGIMPLGDTLPHPETPTMLAWSSESDFVYFQASDGGNGHVYKVDLGGRVEHVTSGDLVCRGYSISQNPSKPGLVYLASTPTNPGDLFMKETSQSQPRRLTDMNRTVLDGVELSHPERITYQNDDGSEIEGWVLKPLGVHTHSPSPMVLQIHGGPHYAYGNTFMHEFQLLASNGFVVLYTNPRGSLGYGQAFAQAAHGDWATLDYKDLMAGVDHMSRQSLVDSTRLGVIGGSYGGYMTNWIIGHTDRFAAAVSDRSEVNLISMWGTADAIQMLALEVDFGRPYDDPLPYLERSPLMYVHKVRTPLLILHGEVDYRCPISEAEQLFTALKRLGREVVFVRYPGENHDLSRSGTPSRRLDRLERIVSWFRSHLIG